MPNLKRNDLVPLWQQIADQLIDEIVRGDIEPGTRLMSEAGLARRFGVNRHTLRRATRHLADQGFVRIRAGAGIFVRKLVLDYALHRTTRLSQNLADNGEVAERELLDSQIEPAGSFANALGVSTQTPVRVLTLRSLIRKRPIALSRQAFPLPRFEELPETFVALRSISRALAQLGVRDYHRLRSVVTTRMPDSEEADWLSRPVSAPVLLVQFTNVDGDGRAVEAGQTVFAADSVQLVVDHSGTDSVQAAENLPPAHSSATSAST